MQYMGGIILISLMAIGAIAICGYWHIKFDCELDNRYKNKYNKYKIIEVEYENEKWYYAKMLVGYLYGFIPYYSNFRRHDWKIEVKNIDSLNMTLFKRKSDLEEVLEILYKESIEEEKLKKQL